MGASDLLLNLRDAGFTLIAVEGGGISIAPASVLTEDQRGAIRAHRAALLVLLANAESTDPCPASPASPDCRAEAGRFDADTERHTTRRDRLLRWGYNESEAEALADRLDRRDREADTRALCVECRHYRPGRCGNHRAAWLNVPDIGGDFAALMQNCEGFAP